MRGKYSAYSQHIQNDMIEGVACPATIAEAEHEAEHWRQEISSANTPRDTPKGAYTTCRKVKHRKKTKKAGNPKTQTSSDDVPTTSQKKSSKTEAADNTCILCGEVEHWAKQCPFRGKVNQLIKEGKIVAVTINPGAFIEDTLTLAAKADGPLGPYDVLLDNQSIVNVFCQRDLLWNLQEVPVMLIGVTDGPKLSSNLSGEVIGADVGRVMYFENASANVLSYDLVADLYTIK